MKGVGFGGPPKNMCPPLCWPPLDIPLILPLYIPLYNLKPFGYHSYSPFPPLHLFYILFEPFGYHFYIPFPLLHLFYPLFEPFGYHFYIPFPLVHHKQLKTIFLDIESLELCESVKLQSLSCNFSLAQATTSGSFSPLLNFSMA